MRSLPIIAVFLTVMSISAGVRVEGGRAIFSYENDTAREVFIAGDFNEWSETATPMSQADGGLWTAELDLPPGRYEYKLIVDGNYMEDPDNPEKAPDPYGGNNSVLVVGEPSDQPAAQAPSREKADGAVFEYYNPSARRVSVAGSFNDWSPDATLLASDGDGKWTAIVPLEPGKHEYKFVVDGAWQPDPENPVTAPDGFGGVNSIIEIGDDGRTVTIKADHGIDRISNTFANSRVYVGGRYTAISESRIAHETDGRLRLGTPRHRLESYLRIKISDDVTAWGGMNIDTRDADRIYEAPLSLDSAAIELRAESVTAQVYYNRTIGGLGDPLEIIGSSKIAGTLRGEIPFGLGTGGAEVRGELAGISFDAIYCDRFSSNATIPHDGSLLDGLGRLRYGLFREDVIDPEETPGLFTQYGTDILGVGLSRDFGAVEMGAVIRRDAGTFWYSIAEMDIPQLDDWIDTSGSTSDWFALGNSELLYGGYVSTALGFTSIWAQFLQYRYSGGVSAGNRENEARDDNGPMDLSLGEFDGRMTGAGIGFRPVEKIELGVQYNSQYFSPPTNRGIFFQPAPSTDGDGRVDLNEFPIAPDMGSTWWESYSAELCADWFIQVSARGGIENMHDRFSGNRRKTWRAGILAEGSILWDFITWELDNEIAFSRPALGGTHDEALTTLALRLALTDDWFFNISAGYYRLAVDDVALLQDLNIKSRPLFSSIEFSPVENVRFELFWGVHPIMANGWPAGRREFVDNYIRKHGATYSEALIELEKVRQVGIRGEIGF